MEKKTQFNLWYLIAALFGVMLLHNLYDKDRMRWAFVPDAVKQGLTDVLKSVRYNLIV